MNIKIHDNNGETNVGTWFTTSTNFTYSGGSSVTTSAGVNRKENPTAVVVTPKPINIYVKTKNDVQPKGHFWNGNGDITTWPGELLTSTEIDGETWYMKTFTDQSSVSFLFNNNGDADKTGNIENVTAGDHYYYYNGAGAYWDVTEPIPSVATVQVGKKYVYFVNEEDWEAPMVYSFTEVGGAADEVNGAWPGQLLNEPVGISPDGHAIYLIEFTGHVPEKLILSNNGDNGSQSFDLEMVNGGYYTNAKQNVTDEKCGYLVGIARGVGHTTGDNTQIIYTTWTLAQILKYGNVGDYYIVANDVTVGYSYDNSTVYIKDTNAEGISPQFPSAAQQANNNQYVYDWVYKGNKDLNFDQSNWARLEAKSGKSFSFSEGHFIQGGTILCKFTDAINPTLQIVSDVDPIEGDQDRTLMQNEYCPANFVVHNESPVPWFFITPKISEYCKIKWAVYSGVENGKATFYVPVSTGEGGMNQYDIAGRLEIAVDERQDKEAFMEGYSYNMTAIINNSGNTLPGRDPSARNVAHAPIDYKTDGNTTGNGTNLILLTAETSDEITAVDDVKAEREVVGVRYFNLQGMTSVEPFNGVNIVITTYNDGTTATKKVLY